ncbi:MAG: hypothetical protein KF708_13375 [Pirellulales bacterium]|nr:hypothetical protein [Pirellulales bacterium]
MTYTSSPSVARRVFWSALCLGLVVIGGDLLSAQEKAGVAKPKLPRGRLPAYYSQVVSPDQKEKIYEVQKSYAPRIKELRAQLATLQTERDAKCRALLTSEQRKKVDELVAEAKAARETAEATAPTTPAAAAPPTASTPPAAAKASASGRKPVAKPSGN